MKLSLQLRGVELAKEQLQGTVERFERSARPLLEELAAIVASALQGHIERQVGPGGSAWPELHPATARIRAYYGHGTTQRLVRNSDLLHSIREQEITDSVLRVGSNHHAARAVNDGGTVVDHRGTRTIQAFPWVYLDQVEVDDIIEAVRDYYLGEGDAARAA